MNRLRQLRQCAEGKAMATNRSLAKTLTTQVATVVALTLLSKQRVYPYLGACSLLWKYDSYSEPTFALLRLMTGDKEAGGMKKSRTKTKATRQDRPTPTRSRTGQNRRFDRLTSPEAHAAIATPSTSLSTVNTTTLLPLLTCHAETFALIARHSGQKCRAHRTPTRRPSSRPTRSTVHQ